MKSMPPKAWKLPRIPAWKSSIRLAFRREAVLGVGQRHSQNERRLSAPLFLASLVMIAEVATMETCNAPTEID